VNMTSSHKTWTDSYKLIGQGIHSTKQITVSATAATVSATAATASATAATVSATAATASATAATVSATAAATGYTWKQPAAPGSTRQQQVAAMAVMVAAMADAILIILFY
jgi:hypothetical protein